MINHLDYEEDYHQKDKKASRKERKLATSLDRSKYKITDQKKQKKSFQESDNIHRGRVLSITGEGIIVLGKDTSYLCSVRGALKKEKTRNKNIIAVGDFVAFAITNEKQGQIIDVEERTSLLERVDISGRKRQTIAANIDQVFITTSVVMPPLKPFLIDRYIIAARKGKMEPVIVINKVDLLESFPEEKKLYLEFLELYAKRDIPVISVSCLTNEHVQDLKQMMEKKASVFSGQSGVGKTSLINILLDMNLPTKEVREKTLKGVHTTTTAQLIPLENGGFCIDTPGIKSFGLWDVHKDDIQNHFQEIKHIALDCKFPDCIHFDEPGCAVKKAVEEGEISSLEFESYTNLMEEHYG